MEKTIRMTEYFADVETVKEHNGYFCSVGQALTIVILGSICGINAIPCYYRLLCLLKLIKPSSLNKCFMQWAQSLRPGEAEGLTISFDGKTIRSTGKMDSYDSPLHGSRRRA